MRAKQALAQAVGIGGMDKPTELRAVIWWTNLEW